MSRLSLYVPLYNAESFLPAMFEKLRLLPAETVQVVLVSDNSSDNTDKMCEEFAGRRKNTVFHRRDKNGGVGMCMNTGLSLCTGEYVTTADQDDTIYPQNLLICLEYAEKNNLDVLLEGFEEEHEDGIVQYHAPEMPAGCSPLEKFWKTCRPLMWAMIIRRKLIETHSIRLSEANLGHDKYFIRHLMQYVSPDRLGVMDIPVYRHNCNEGSISRARLETLVEKKLTEYENAKKLADEQVTKGLIDKEYVYRCIKDLEARSYLRSLYKARKFRRAAAEYERITADIGTNKKLKKNYIRSKLLGLFSKE